MIKICFIVNTLRNSRFKFISSFYLKNHNCSQLVPFRRSAPSFVVAVSSPIRRIIPALRCTIPTHFVTPNPHILSHHTHHIFPHQVCTFCSTKPAYLVAPYPHILSHCTVVQLQNEVQLQNWGTVTKWDLVAKQK